MLRTTSLVASAMLLAALAAVAGPPARQEVRISVTPKGFVPAVVTVQAGKPVTLLVTRRTDRTCATAFVLKPYGIREVLPLGRTVAIRFTPGRPGELTYACGMDMVQGRIVVR